MEVVSVLFHFIFTFIFHHLNTIRVTRSDIGCFFFFPHPLLIITFLIITVVFTITVTITITITITQTKTNFSVKK